jgi:hypothetical protein
LGSKFHQQLTERCLQLDSQDCHQLVERCLMLRTVYKVHQKVIVRCPQLDTVVNSTRSSTGVEGCSLLSSKVHQQVIEGCP